MAGYVEVHATVGELRTVADDTSGAVNHVAFLTGGQAFA
jgi:hypothetical protein